LALFQKNVMRESYDYENDLLLDQTIFSFWPIQKSIFVSWVTLLSASSKKNRLGENFNFFKRSKKVLSRFSKKI